MIVRTAERLVHPGTIEVQDLPVQMDERQREETVLLVEDINTAARHPDQVAPDLVAPLLEACRRLIASLATE